MTIDSKELETALSAVAQATIACRSIQSSITPETLNKKDRSPVTIADFASQAIVCAHLEREFSDDPVIGEEDSTTLREEKQSGFLARVTEEVGNAGLAGSNEQICHWIDRGGSHDFSPRFWTLDPIDGTKGFLRNEQYAVSLALIVDGRIQIAVLGCPNLSIPEFDSAEAGRIFFAVAGKGAWVTKTSDLGFRQQVHVRETDQSANAILCESVESGHSSHDQSAQVAALLGIQTEPVRLDSQAKYASVAAGQTDLYLRLPTRADYREKIWDHAGGALIVEEAGGQVSDIHGNPLDWTRGFELNRNRGVVVSNRRLHAAALDALKSVGVN